MLHSVDAYRVMCDRMGLHTQSTAQSQEITESFGDLQLRRTKENVKALEVINVITRVLKLTVILWRCVLFRFVYIQKKPLWCAE